MKDEKTLSCFILPPSYLLFSRAPVSCYVMRDIRTRLTPKIFGNQENNAESVG